ncbi:MAG: hypothetical protein R3D01_09295 [Hyphomicrobiales bacterium]
MPHDRAAGLVVDRQDGEISCATHHAHTVGVDQAGIVDGPRIDNDGEASRLYPGILAVDFTGIVQHAANGRRDALALQADHLAVVGDGVVATLEHDSNVATDDIAAGIISDDAVSAVELHSKCGFGHDISVVDQRASACVAEDARLSAGFDQCACNDPDGDIGRAKLNRVIRRFDHVGVDIGINDWNDGHRSSPPARCAERIRALLWTASLRRILRFGLWTIHKQEEHTSNLLPML